MIGDAPQQRLDVLQVVEDPAQLLGGLAVWVLGALLQSFQQRLDGRAEQDDVVEARMELRLVLLAAGEEQDVGVLGVEQPDDRVLAPALASVAERLRPAVVRVDRLVAASGERLDDARFAGSGHAREEHPLHGAEDRGASPFRGVDKVGECGLEWGEVEINHEAPDDAPRRVRTHDR